MADRWFKIKGQAKGDRTLEEQMTGLQPALAGTPGRSVLDLGCAEGLIGREFARAGAAAVHGVEMQERHLIIARELCAGLPMTFQCADLDEMAARDSALPPRYDIVLALAVLHKLFAPENGARFCARASRSLVVVRLPANSEANRGILRSKHNPAVSCDLTAVMTKNGFALERTLPGPRQEPVQYWRRSVPSAG